MKLLAAAFAALVLAPAASAANVTIVRRDVALRLSGRSLAAATPRFDMVGLHWQGPGRPLFRTRDAGGRWSAWQVSDDDWGRSGPWRKGAAEWTGAADAIQYRLRGRVTRLRAFLLWSPVERASPRRLSLAGSPSIIPRAAWGADESIRRAPPLYADAVRFALVHHTVNSNDYTPAQSAAIVRGIEVYHVKGNGWNDIGYNFLVDKYGQVFEGRYGGIDRNVVGAHSQGFNAGSVGVAVIGTYSHSGIPPAARTALERLLAWRLDIAHVDPLSTLSFPSGGNTKFPAGIPAFLRAISGHRDTYLTDCPGDALYAQLPGIAKDVAAIGLPKLYAPAVTGQIGGPVRFTGRLSSALPWTVTVKDASGATVASGTGTGPTVDWTWDATAVSAGSYGWTIDAGPSVRPATGKVGAKLPPLSIGGLHATPATISPNGDGVDDSASVSYSLALAATVTATLADPTGRTASTLFAEPLAAGKQSFTFSVGDSVPDGRYTIVLQAQSSDGQQATASVGVTIDRAVTAFTVAPAAFSPNGDGVQDLVGVDFVLARPAGAKVEVLRGGTPIATLASGSYGADSPVDATWDGTAGGTRATDGSYSVVLTVGDAAAASVRSVPVVLDTRPPRLRPVSWQHLRFAVDGPVTVTLTAGSRRYVKNAKAAGPIYFWLKAPPRRYTIVARDAAGNAATLSRP